ncbi:nitrate- and nitrite sensing domain-containing protein [Bailinhaonella thermotolerans]|uniref:nitrate- and nitrite sensing domain-containing protein n=1 Tax=Bailinhaonella thermotolerans TaxID=1070861 RepID=UPI0011C45B7C|nr:nitrate- and nitrite sensing domain-containing protein [Bailinhaonella thermotolerans]
MRSRLVALILVPTIVAVGMGGLRLAESLSSANAYKRVSELAHFNASVSDLVYRLEQERDTVAWYIAVGRVSEGKATERIEKTNEDVDVAASTVRSEAAKIGDAHTERVRRQVAQILVRVQEIANLRKIALKEKLLPLPAVTKYSEVITDLLTINEDIGQGAGDEELIQNVRALRQLSEMKERMSQQRAIGTAAAVSAVPRFDPNELQTFINARAGQESALRGFRAEASQSIRQLYEDTVTGREIDRAEAFRERAMALARDGKLLDLDPARADDGSKWFDSMSFTIDQMRKVEVEIGKLVIARAETLRTDARNGAVTFAAITLLVLILALTFTAFVARSMVRPLRRLRSEALEVAGRRLPEMVQQLRESDGQTEIEVRPIPVTSSDEIGEVARAFDEVHREAVRLAGGEAQLRGTVNAMFVNLSRRSQTLVERQLSLIDGLEQGEQDEQRLASLFKLDHLATRMRRNSENLLVLAGQEPARRWAQPIQLVDVVRASLSEVENYDRVALRVQSGPSVAGQAVNDVVHLLAELVENAISFSPRDTKVVVSGHRTDDGGAMLTVSDSGIGMPPEELAEANHRLASPPVVDVSVSRRMGLFVVGRLAARHGIRVQLRQQELGGVTALVLLPENLVVQPGGQTGAAPLFGGQSAPAFGLTGETPAPAGDGAPAFGAFGGGSESGAFGGRFGADTSPSPVGAEPVSYGAPPLGAPPAATDAPVFGTSTGPQSFSAFGTSTGPQASPETSAFGGPSGSHPSSAFGGPSGSHPASAFGGPSGGHPASAFGTTTGPQFGTTTGPQGTPRDFGGPSGPHPSQAYGGPPAPQQQAPAFGGPSGPQPGASTSGGWRVPDRPAQDAWGGGTGEVPSFGDPAETGPLPVVPDTPLEGEDYLPIFAAVESDWFRRRDPEPVTGEPAEEAVAEAVAEAAEPVAEAAPPVAEKEPEMEKPEPMERPAARPASSTQPGGWRSAGDEGWKAAEAAKAPALGGTTAAGLPKRVPRANLVPGSVETRPTSLPPAQPTLSPERVRSRLSSFQEGIRQGRAAARGERAPEAMPTEDPKE